MDEFFTRATVVHDHVEALKREAQGVTDVERLSAIHDEMDVCLRSLEAIRAEQIFHYAELDKGPLRTHWWQIWRRTT